MPAELEEQKTLGKPAKTYHLELEEMGAGIEKLYFWVLNFLKDTPPSGLSYKNVYKVKDIYTATETSSYWGMVEQRKGMQQEKVSAYLAAIGKMVKDLFQIVRELRIMDERYEYYEKSKTGDESAEIALKSIWVDMVEGGAKNPASVLGLSTQVGFVILPDLFFKISPKTSDDVDKEVDSLGEQGINRKVREVLSRKLKQYMIWKEKTDHEIKQRKKFMLKYLRQHYNVIHMYINWVRPYLKNIRKLQMAHGKETEPYLVTAFETSKIELELIASRGDEKFEMFQPCLRITFDFIAMPQMAYQNEYQKGAIHTGLTKINIEAYSLKKEQIDDYIKEIEQEDFELLESVNAAMTALKDDLMKYLQEAGEEFKEKKEEVKEESKGFQKIIDEFKKTFGIGMKKVKPEKLLKKKLKAFGIEKEQKESSDQAKTDAYVMYDIFKKANQMLTW